jgi:hypothetical protein
MASLDFELVPSKTCDTSELNQDLEDVTARRQYARHDGNFGRQRSRQRPVVRTLLAKQYRSVQHEQRTLQHECAAHVVAKHDFVNVV